VEKPKGKRPLGRPKRRLVDSIKIDLGWDRWSGVHLTGPAQDRNKWRALMNCGYERTGYRKCWEIIEWLHDWWPVA
jgi:hypothetical protein